MFTTRRATVEDLDELVRIRDLFLEEMGRLAEGITPREASDAFRGYARRKLPAGEFVAWVAEAGGEVAATCAIVFFERPPNGLSLSGLEAYLLNMYTLPRWRGRGMAAALVRVAVEHVKATQARRLWLHTTAAGRRVYEKAGFVARDTEMELVW